MEAAAPLPGLEAEILAPIVAQALDRPVDALAGWTIQAIHGGAGETLGVFRVAGTLADSGQSSPWSVILKVLGQPEAGGQPGDWNDWRREAQVYQSAIAGQLPAGLALPRCFGAVDQPDGRLWLWLEDIRERPGDWALADYGRVAFLAGQFNGPYLNGRPLPQAAWLSQGWLRGWVEQSAGAVAHLPAALAHPMARRASPPEYVEALLQAWAERDWYFQLLARLPQTLCHMDVFRRNVLARAAPHDDYVLLDWSFIGRGAVGEELVALVLGSLLLFEVELAAARDMEETALAGYVSGLRAAGWAGDPRLARLGYAAAGALRYTLGPLALLTTALTDERYYPWIEQIFKRPVGDCCDAWADLDRQVTVPLIASVRPLAAELGL